MDPPLILSLTGRGEKLQLLFFLDGAILGLAQCLLGEPRDPIDRDDHDGAPRLGPPRILVEAEVLGRPLVVRVNPEEQHDEGRDSDDDHPGTLGEFGD